MKKRLLAAFACLCMLLTLLPAAVFAGEGEVEPGVEPKAVTVDPASYEYDPNYRDQFSAPDAYFTVQRDAGVEITGVTAQNQQGETVALTKGTEYRVSAWSGELIIDNNYMSGLPLNSTTQLTVTLSDGTTVAFSIVVPEVCVIHIVCEPAGAAGLYCDATGIYRADEFYVKPGEGITLDYAMTRYYELTGWAVDGQEMDLEHPLELSPMEDMTVTLSARMMNFGLEADKTKLEFGSVAVGYDRPAAQEFTLTNTGDMPMQLSFDNMESSEVLQNYEFTLVSGPEDGVLELGQSTTIRVQPKADLPAGEYTETLNVTGGELPLEPNAARSGEEEGEPVTPEPITVPVTLSFSVYELCTVTFDANGHGTAPAALENVHSGTAIAAPTAPEAEGWTFLGWYREAGCENAWNFDTDLVEGSMTLYANWEQKAAPSPAPTETPAPTATPAPSATPAPTEQPSATEQPAATAQPTATAQPAAAQAPQTGDSSMLAWLGLAGAAVCGLVALERLRKKG